MTYTNCACVSNFFGFLGQQSHIWKSFSLDMGCFSRFGLVADTFLVCTGTLVTTDALGLGFNEMGVV